MEESSDLLRAISLIKAGQKADAIPILKRILQSNRNNEAAWLWLATCATEDKDKQYCFQEALRINPNNGDAKIALDHLKQPQTPQPTISEMVQRDQNTSAPGQSPTSSSSHQTTRVNHSPSISQWWIILGALIVTVIIIVVGKNISSAVSHKNNPCVVITQKFAYPDYQMGYSKIGGDIQNNCDHTVSYIKLSGQVFDRNGVLIGSDWAYAENHIVSSGQTSSFEILIFNATNMGSYSVDVADWDDQ